MSDPTLDLAVQTLRTGGRIAMTVPELAAIVRPAVMEPAILERRLREDSRFVVLDDGAGLPGLEHWPADQRAAYAAALQGTTLADRPLILLADPPDRADLLGLLHGTVLDLLGMSGVAMVAAAADHLRCLLGPVTPLAGEGPTTSLPPGPRPPQ